MSQEKSGKILPNIVSTILTPMSSNSSSYQSPRRTTIGDPNSGPRPSDITNTSLEAVEMQNDPTASNIYKPIIADQEGNRTLFNFRREF